MLSAFGLFRRLSQQIFAGGKRTKKLIVQIVPVGENYQRGIGHRGVLDDFAGIERHREALAAALRMPHHARTAVSFDGCGVQRAFDSLVDGMELVIARDLLLGLLAVVLKHDEAAHQIEETLFLEYAAKQDLHLERAGRANLVSLDGPPRHEAFPTGRERAQTCFDSVGDHEQFVVREEARNVVLVCLKLIEGVADRGVLIGQILQFDHRKREAIDENDHVRATVPAVLFNRELIDCDPVVVRGRIAIEQPRVIVNDSVRPAVFHGHAVRQEGVEAAVVFDKAWTLCSQELSDGFVECVGWNFWINSGERLAQTLE